MRPSPEKKQERDRVRLTLMRATLRLAGTHGFAGLGLREVAREADIAPTSFYRHFTDIEELGRVLVEQLVAQAISEVIAAVEQTGLAAGDAVRSMVDGLLLAVINDPDLIRFVLAERYGVNAGFRSQLREQLNGLIAALLRGVPWAERPGADAAVWAALDGCNQLLEIDVAERVAKRDVLAEQVATTMYAMLRSGAVKAEGP